MDVDTESEDELILSPSPRRPPQGPRPVSPRKRTPCVTRDSEDSEPESQISSPLRLIRSHTDPDELEACNSFPSAPGLGSRDIGSSDFESSTRKSLPKSPSRQDSKDHAHPVQAPPYYIHLQRPDFEKHPTLFFSDGSLFIQLAKMRFRLHKTRLANTSQFFNELFRLRDSSWEQVLPMEISLESGDAEVTTVVVEAEEVYKIDLYVLDNVDLDLADFEMLMMLDTNNEMRYSPDVLPFSTLASVLRAAKTLRCYEMFTWAIACIEKQWTQPSYLVPIPNAWETFVLARKYNMDISITMRALYELLRIQAEDDTRARSLPSDCFLKAREMLNKAWVTITESQNNFVVPCPLTPRPEGTVPLCTSHSPPDIGRTHNELVHEHIFKQHLFDPIGGLEALITMEKAWRVAGYCVTCIHLKKSLWAEQREKMVQDLKVFYNEL